jgi:hypothetical protein
LGFIEENFDTSRFEYNTAGGGLLPHSFFMHAVFHSHGVIRCPLGIFISTFAIAAPIFLQLDNRLRPTGKQCHPSYSKRFLCLVEKKKCELKKSKINTTIATNHKWKKQTTSIKTIKQRSKGKEHKSSLRRNLYEAYTAPNM